MKELSDQDCGGILSLWKDYRNEKAKYKLPSKGLE